MNLCQSNGLHCWIKISKMEYILYFGSVLTISTNLYRTISLCLHNMNSILQKLFKKKQYIMFSCRIFVKLCSAMAVIMKMELIITKIINFLEDQFIWYFLLNIGSIFTSFQKGCSLNEMRQFCKGFYIHYSC